MTIQKTLSFKALLSIFLLAVLLGLAPRAEAAPTYDWTLTSGGTTSDNANSVATDSSGNIFTTGYFTGTADFDPTGGTDEHTSAGGNDIFLTKINSDGTYGWTRTMGGTGSDAGYSVATDTSGNVFVTGNFWGTVDFDPTGGTDSHTSAGGHDTFLTKIKADGTYGWTLTACGDYGRSVTTDSSGNIFMTGYFQGTCDLDPTAGVDNRNTVGGSDIYLTKIKADGTYGWTLTSGGTSGDIGYGVAIDASGNIFTTGSFQGTDVNLDPTGGTDNHTSAGFYDIFLTKINSDGTYGWTLTAGGTGSDYAYAVATDSSGNIYVTGLFEGTDTNLDPTGGTDEHTSNGWSDIFLTKINADGTYGWSLTSGGTNYDYSKSVAIDLSGNIFLTGHFISTDINFDPTGGTDNHTSVGFYDIFLTKINSDGTYGWTLTAGGTGSDYAYAVATDSSGNVFVTGMFEGTDIDLDPTGGTDEHTSAGDYDIFLTKIIANTAPVATDGEFGTDQNTAGSGTLSATDDDSDSLAYSIVSNGTKGTATITNAATGAFTYTPITGQIGNDTFTFKANDGTVDSNTATATVTIMTDNHAYDWTLTPGGTGDEYARAVTTDASGNIFMTGRYTGTANLDPTGGTDEHISASGSSDIFLTKINSDASYGWSYTMGSAGEDYGNGVATDSLGNVYTTGHFKDTVNFDPTGGTDNHTSAGNWDTFLTKIKPGSSYGWTLTLGGTGDDIANGVATDNLGNIFLAGSFTGTANFDPTGGTDNHTSNGNNDIFLTKIKADGTYGWTRTMGGTATDIGNAVTLDSSGNIFVTGYFSGTADFDSATGPDNHTSAGSYDIFLTKINVDGTYGWTKTMGGTSHDRAYGVATDTSGNIYTTGEFMNTVDFDPDGSGDSQTSAGSSDIFLTKINSDSTYGWTKIMGGTSAETTYAVTTDLSGNIYTTGMFKGTADFNPDGSGDSQTSAGSWDIFITRINSDGTYGWTKAVGGTGVDRNDGIAVDPTGNIFAAGYFNGTVDFDPASGTDSHTSAGVADIALIKLLNDIDDVAPVTVASPTGGTYAVDQFVDLTCTDSHSGCDKIYYTTNGAAPTTSSNEYTGTITVEVNTTLRFFSVDKAGNEEDDTLEPYYDDEDVDGVSSDIDNCDYVSNVGQADSDSDDIGDACDGGSTDSGYVSGDDGSDAPGGDSIAGVSRADAGDDANNLSGGNAKLDLEYIFSVDFIDAGGAPIVEPKLYLAHKTAPVSTDFFFYDMTCAGAAWVTGKSCTISLILAPATAHKFYFMAIKTDGTVIRLPESGYLDGPAIKRVVGYSMLSAARDVNSANLSGATTFDCSKVVRWVSNGLDTEFNVTFDGYWEDVTSNAPAVGGAGYFVNSCSSDQTPEHSGYDDYSSDSFTVTLQAGWNLIANPYNGDVLLSDTQIKKGSDAAISWDAATTATYVVNGIYYYTGSDWGETYLSESSGGSPDATLAPWFGYWIYVGKDDDTYYLIIPRPAQ